MNSGIGVLLDNIGLHHFGVWVVRALVVAIVRCRFTITFPLEKQFHQAFDHHVGLGTSLS
jgi:hypothetical protein